MSLGDVQHQGFAQRLIQRAVSGQRVPHGYLFHGPDGVGKETLALGLAQLLLCGSPVERELGSEESKAVGLDRLRTGCGACEDCRTVGAQTHPDLHMVYRQLGREHPDPEVRRRKALDLGVDVVRHFVIDKVGLTPIRGRAKVFILREADRMTVQAQNALLKTLEEPPGATVIILLVSVMDRLLPTTLSRCQAVRFDALPTAFIRAKLAALMPGVDSDRLDWYARHGEGSLGRTMQCAADEVYELNERMLADLVQLSADARLASAQGDSAREVRSGEIAKSWLDEAKSLGERHRKRDPDITETEASRRGLKAVFELAATWYADVMRWGSGDESAVVNAHWTTQIREVTERLEVHVAAEAVSRLARAGRQLDLNANTQLCVEALLSELARLGDRETARSA